MAHRNKKQKLSDDHRENLKDVVKGFQGKRFAEVKH
jgi:hypothetical protein